MEAVYALGCILLGAYLLGFIAVLWACPEPFPDRLAIAAGWPAAIVYLWWRDY